MTRALKILLTFLLVAGGGWMLRPWAAQQIGSLARTSYFEQGRAHGPRMIEELGPLPSELRESSGLAVSRTQPGVLWSHNDSGDTPTLYAIDLKGRLLARVAVTDAIARDWEDIAMGTCPWEESSGRQCLYVADTGNNDRSRNVLTVFVVLEPTVAEADPARPLLVQARAFRFRYPGESEDAEAIAVRPNGDVTIVTKGRTQKISFFGVSRVPFWTHFWASLLGYVPPLLLVSTVGSQLFDADGQIQPRALAMLGGLLVASLLFAAILRRHGQRRTQ